MNFVAENCVTDRRQYLKLAHIVLIAILFAFCTVTKSYGWGSTKGIAPTHNKIVSLALDHLEKDLGFRSSQFPSKNLILSNDWVIPSKGGMVGPGPDGDGNSKYSFHYYNPITPDGGAPDAISDQLESFLLQKIQLGQTTTDGVGKSAAWSAHYLADMNVPYHVVGTSWKTAFKRKGSSILDSATIKFTTDETGPHKLYSLPYGLSFGIPRFGWGADSNFKFAVETFFFFYPPGSTQDVDWFDPWYLNGNTTTPIATVKSLAGSHAIWELEAANTLTDYKITTELDAIIAKRGPYDPKWENKRAQWGKKFYGPVSIVAKEYAKKVASRTRSKISKIWKQPEIGMANAVWAVSTMYRGSMTSLEPTVSVTTPSAGVHDVIVRLTNRSDINSHSNIEVKFSLNNGSSVEGYTGKIGPESTGEVILRIEDSNLKNIKGKIEVRSDSDKCPDLGYSLRRINVDVDNTGAKSQPDMVVVPELIGMTEAEALEVIKNPNFVFVPKSLGPGPSEALSNLIIEQKPAPHSSVSRGTTVKFSHYDEWIQPETPDEEDEKGPDTDKNEKIPQEQDLPDAKNDTGIGSEECTNGLIIVGPSLIYTGQGVTYTAHDRDGNVYSSGNFSWMNSDESIMNLDRSGNPVRGVGFKPGTFVIMMHCGSGDYTFLDVEIKKKEDNLFSTSGGQKTVTGSSLFSSAGGEKKQAHIPSQNSEENKLKNQCSQLLNNISTALDRGDTKSAQNFTNSAFALGCDIDPGVLAQVENIEKRTKEQREQGVANIAREEKQRDEECLKIRTGILSAINQKNVALLQNLVGIAADMGCDENTSGLNQIIAKIKVEERQQQQAQQQTQIHRPQQPQNQTNWMDVMNLIVKGVRDVQQGHGKPNKTSFNQNTKTCTTCPKRNPGTQQMYKCKAPGNTKVVYLRCEYAKNGMLKGEVFFGKKAMIRYNSFRITGNSSYLSAVWNYDDQGKKHGKEQQWWRANVTRFIKTWNHDREVEKCIYDKNGKFIKCIKY